MRARAVLAFSLALGAAAAGVGCSLVTSFDGVALGAADAGANDADAEPESGAADAGADVDAAICFAGGYYCGGDHNPEAAGNLYRCTADGGGFVLALTCAEGCVARNGADDVCQCVVGSAYCGGDQVVGAPGTLYTCGAGYTPVEKQVCPNGCKTNVGTDDTCY